MKNGHVLRRNRLWNLIKYNDFFFLVWGYYANGLHCAITFPISRLAVKLHAEEACWYPFKSWRPFSVCLLLGLLA